MRIASVLCSVLLLVGCATNPAPYQGRDYSAEPVQRLGFSGVLVDSQYTAPGSAPNVEHTLPTPPEAALRTALQQRYQSIRPQHAGAVQMRLTITDAHITETPLDQPKDWAERTFNSKPDTQFDGRLVVVGQTEGPISRPYSFAAESTRTLTVGGLDKAGRERQLAGMTAQLVDDVMDQIAKQFDEALAGHVISGPDDSVMPVPSGRWDKVRDWK